MVQQDDSSSSNEEEEENSVNALSAISRPELLEQKKGVLSQIVDKLKGRPTFEKLRTDTDSASINIEMGDVEDLSTQSNEFNEESPDIDEEETESRVKKEKRSEQGRVSEPSKMEVTLSLLKDRTVQKVLYLYYFCVSINIESLIPTLGLWIICDVVNHLHHTR